MVGRFPAGSDAGLKSLFENRGRPQKATLFYTNSLAPMNECAGEKETGRASHDAHISKSRYGAPGTRHPVDGQHYLLTLVEEANACDAGGSGIKAGGSIFEGDA